MARILYVFGAGGHGREIAWFARAQDVDREVRFVVDQPRFLAPDGHIAIHLVQDEVFPRGAEYVLALGDAAARRAADRHFNRTADELVPATIVHPAAVLAPSVNLAPGSVIAPNAILSDNVAVGRHSHVNIGATLSHDVVVGEFVTIAPGVNIAGHVTVGDGAFVGVGATVINGDPTRPLVIGDGAFIAAGACVVNDVEARAKVVGVPATRRG